MGRRVWKRERVSYRVFDFELLVCLGLLFQSQDEGVEVLICDFMVFGV